MKEKSLNEKISSLQKEIKYHTNKLLKYEKNLEKALMKNSVKERIYKLETQIEYHKTTIRTLEKRLEILEREAKNPFETCAAWLNFRFMRVI